MGEELFSLYIYYECKNERHSRALFLLIGLRQTKVVDGDSCGMYNPSIKQIGKLDWV